MTLVTTIQKLVKIFIGRHKMKYVIYNKKDNEHYFGTFESATNCRHWIINFMDLSKDWSFKL